jgi:two-component system, chemotaxis family, chemotaxis protein CheY
MSKPTRILTVDDSASMRALLLHALTSSGFEVAQADDGIAALEWLSVNEVDVVITDINMPRLDGFGLIERLRAGNRHHDRPILAKRSSARAMRVQRGGSSSPSIRRNSRPPCGAWRIDPVRGGKHNAT